MACLTRAKVADMARATIAAHHGEVSAFLPLARLVRHVGADRFRGE